MPVTLMRLRPWSCRYPLEDDERGVSMRFCGEPADAGSPYCASHRKLCFVPPDRQQRRLVSYLPRAVSGER